MVSTSKLLFRRASTKTPPRRVALVHVISSNVVLTMLCIDLSHSNLLCIMYRERSLKIHKGGNQNS